MYTRIPEKGSFQFQSFTSADTSSSFVVDHIEEEASYHQTISLEGKRNNDVIQHENIQNNEIDMLNQSKHSFFKYALLFIAGSLVTSLMYRLTSEASNEPFKLGEKSYSCSLDNMEGPFLYITQHSGTGILKYSMDGCYRGNKVLEGGAMRKVQLRSMYIGTFRGSEALIVADSTHHNSRVVLYGPCMNSTGLNDDDQNDDPGERLLDDDADDSMETVLISEESIGRRQYIIDVIDELGFPYNTRRGATHPYGIAQDKEGNIYASFQDSDSVLRFRYDPDAPYVEHMAETYIKDKTVPGAFVPVKSPPGLPKLHGRDQYYNGTFVQFGTPRQFGGIEDMGIRAILFVEDNLWVADEDNGVSIINPDGIEIGHIDIKKPVGLAYSKNHRVVFVSTREGKVKAYLITGKFKHAYDIPNPDKYMKFWHPVGMAVNGHKLFIADQHYGEVYEYDITRNIYVRTIITGLDRVEQMTISDC